MENSKIKSNQFEVVIMTTAIDRPDLHTQVFTKYKNYLKGVNIKWVITINNIWGNGSKTELQFKQILKDFDVHIKMFPTGGTRKDFFNSVKYCINFAKEINPSKGYLWLEDDWEVNSGTFSQDLDNLVDTNTYVALVNRTEVSFNPSIWGPNLFNNHLYFNINNPEQSLGAKRYFDGENTNPERICCPHPETSNLGINIKTIPRFKDVGRDWQNKNIKVRTFNVKEKL